MAQCDFCSSTEIRWRYPTQSFSPGLGYESVGDFAACDACHDLIEKDDREGLLTRSVETMPILPLPREFAEFAVRTIHIGFFNYRTGPATREE